jgi:uncharacterized cupredoxin-like copper-binding protein
MKSRLILLGVVGALAVVGCGSSSSSASGAGKAGDAAKADRTVEVHILSSKKYNPATVSVKSGETVTFKVTNDDTSLHEFVLGDQKAQDAHEKEMAAMSMDSMKMADTSNRIDLDGGESKQLTWTFPTKTGASVIYGSHVPNDYSGGLKGIVTVG